MADNINFNQQTGKYSFVSKQEPAWHKLGTIVDAMTSKEAMELGGLNFIVEKRPLLVTSSQEIPIEEGKNHKIINRTIEKRTIYQGEYGENAIQVRQAVYRPMLQVPDKFATVRTDNNQPLGIVGSRYEVIQNSEAFDFIDSIIGEGVADYETVGALGEGETVFITCKLKKEMIINKDLIDQYLLITMSHDGSSSITVMFTPIRVVCNNTLSAALKGTKNKVTIRHTKSAKDKLELSKQLLGIVDQQGLTYEETFKRIHKQLIFDEEAQNIIAFSLGIDIKCAEDISTRSQNMFNSAWEYYHTGIGQKEIIGTGWGVYNAVTGYLQNVKEYSSPELKFKNTFLTSGADIRTKVLDQILCL